jgi:hypothetical protein
MKEQFAAGVAGYLDGEMSGLTGVKPGAAPSLFSDVEERAKTIKGHWRLMRTSYMRRNSDKTSQRVELLDSISGLGFGIKPETADRFYWKLSGDNLEIYDSNGKLSYRFTEFQTGKFSFDYWKGHKMHRGEIFYEVGKPVVMFLTREK